MSQFRFANTMNSRRGPNTTRRGAVRRRRPSIEGLEDRCLLAVSASPIVATLPASLIIASGAVLHGSVNPNGTTAAALFQYSTDPSLPANVVTTLAGRDEIGSMFFGPRGVAVDGAGNVYVADGPLDVIDKVTPGGTVTLLAGSNLHPGSADGTGTDARFNGPGQVALDDAGNLYVADTGNDTIRKITPAGVVTTLAGSPGQAGSTDGTGAAARFNAPMGVAVDHSGNVYVADTGNDTIRVISPSGAVTTLAGSAGQAGSADATGGAARFHTPSEVAVDRNGNVYVADTGNDTVRMISPSKAVTTLAGSAGQTGSLDGIGAAARFSGPIGVAVDDAGSVYVTDTSDPNYALVRRILSGGAVTTLAGSATQQGYVNGVGAAARFGHAVGIAVDGAGNLYVGDESNASVRKMSILSVPSQRGLTGTTALPVSSVLAALTANTTYYYRAMATSGAGVAVGATMSFTTATVPAPPTVTTQAVTSVTSTGVTLHGTANPNGSTADTLFQFSTDPNMLPNVVTTVAGLSGSYDSVDGTGTTARFNNPQNVAVDPRTGDLYVADFMNNMVRKITPAGVVTTIAGVYNQPYHTDGSLANARFFSPGGVAVDAWGNLYVGDSGNNDIRKITPDGVVSTLAGDWNQNGYADGTGKSALFFNPETVVVDPRTGNLYVADAGNGLIRVVTPNGVVTTLPTYWAAQLDNPESVAVDGAGNVYIADTFNYVIRKFTPDGMVSVLAGAIGQAGSADGVGGAARFVAPRGITVDPSGILYVADTNNNTIRRITPDGTVTTLAGTANMAGAADGTGASARFFAPYGVTADAFGNLFVAESYNSTIRKLSIPTSPAAQGLTGNSPVALNSALSGLRPGTTYYYRAVATGAGGTIFGAVMSFTTAALAPPAVTTQPATGATLHGDVTPNGVSTSALFQYSTDPNMGAAVTTMAGTARLAGTDDGTGAAARFNSPSGVAVDPRNGTVYVVDTGSSIVRKVTPAGAVTTIIGPQTLLYDPEAVAVDPRDGTVYVADTGSSEIRKIAPDGTLSRLLGMGMIGDLNTPEALAVDPRNGNIFVADTGHQTILKVAPDGTYTVFAGTLGAAGSVDGTGAAARFRNPQGIVVDSAGNVYVADTGNDTIRKITPAGVVTTLAGSAGLVGSTDGALASARFDGPRGLAVDAAGNLYVADTANGTIRMITPAGVVTTVAGKAGQVGSADGRGTAALFDSPRSVSVDSAGNLYVADAGNDTIRKITPPAAAVLAQSGLTGANPVAVSAVAPGLTPGTTYYYRAVASSDGGTAQGELLSFVATVSPPAATTQAATAVTTTGATLHAIVNPAGSATTVTFTYGTDPALSTGTVTTAAQAIGSGTVDVAVSAPLTGLAAGQTYYFRVSATNTGGSTAGAIMSLTTATPQAAPTATTQAASAITTGGATLHGSVNPHGAATILTFVYGTDPALATNTVTTAAQAIGSGTVDVAVSAPLTGLAAGQTYYFRVSATNAGGATSGAILSFTTATLPLLAPTATTQAATAISTAGATLHANVNPQGLATTVAFVYGTDPALATGVVTTAEQAIGFGKNDVAVSAPLTGLAPGLTCYFRVTATSAGGTNRGAILSFTTTRLAPPTATTQAATAVTDTAATLHALVNPKGSSTLAVFLYGTDPNLTGAIGNLFGGPDTQAIGNGTSDVALSRRLTGLAPSTTYYFAIAAGNNSGGNATIGATMSFTTLAATSMTLAPPTPNPAHVGQTVTFDATIAASGATKPPAGELVTFREGTATLGTAPLDGTGHATFRTTFSTAGNHTVTALYAGDASFSASPLSNGATAVVQAAAKRQTALTNLNANPNPALVGQPITLAVVVSPATVAALSAQASQAAPGGLVTFVVDGQAQAPVNVVAFNGLGVAALVVHGLAVGTHQVAAVYSGDSSFAASQTLVPISVTVAAVPSGGPQVVNVQRFGFHWYPTAVVLTFNQPLDPVRAQNAANYVVLTASNRRIPILSAAYNAQARTVTLHPARLLPLHGTYRLWVNGSAATGLTGVTGLPLQGAGAGHPGTSFTTTITRANLVQTPKGAPV